LALDQVKPLGSPSARREKAAGSSVGLWNLNKPDGSGQPIDRSNPTGCFVGHPRHGAKRHRGLRRASILKKPVASSGLPSGSTFSVLVQVLTGRPRRGAKPQRGLLPGFGAIINPALFLFPGSGTRGLLGPSGFHLANQ
jgi:hypothetical protein